MAMTQERSHKSKGMPKKVVDQALEAAGSTRGKGNRQEDCASGIDAPEREMLVARLAYFRAEKRGFVPGMDQKDWFEAEAEALLLSENQ